MKTCKRCFREFDENDDTDDNPAIDLSDIFIYRIGNDKDLCPECREDFGLFSLLGLNI